MGIISMSVSKYVCVCESKNVDAAVTVCVCEGV
jgi:hypothetical protein